MNTITDKLADALRTIDEQCQTGLNSSVYSHWSAALEDVMRTSRWLAQNARARNEGLPVYYDGDKDTLLPQPY